MTVPRDLIASADPLSLEVATFLCGYAEEDDSVDYKLTFDHQSEKAWLELTKDVSALANTFGGYLVLGVENKTKEMRSITSVVADAIRDSNNILQKVNRHLEPHMTGLRTKIYQIDAQQVGVIFVPQSIGRTHLIVKDGTFNHPSGKPKLLLRKGTFYVRRSGANHLGDTRDLDDIIERRIDQFRAALLEKITKVVNLPATDEIYVLSKDPNDETGKSFIIKDSPDSIAVKGMSLTMAPEGSTNEIASWSVLCHDEPTHLPPPDLLWKWYADRETVEITQDHKLSLFRFGLKCDVAVFFWIRGLKNADIRRVLLSVIRDGPAVGTLNHVMIVASFLGKSTYSAALAALGPYKSRLKHSMTKYPTSGPRAEFGTLRKKPGQSPEKLKRSALKDLDSIAISAASKRGVPDALERLQAHDFDCALYAQDDQYK
jgi:hypothetical protein